MGHILTLMNFGYLSPGSSVSLLPRHHAATGAKDAGEAGFCSPLPQRELSQSRLTRPHAGVKRSSTTRKVYRVKAAASGGAYSSGTSQVPLAARYSILEGPFSACRVAAGGSRCGPGSFRVR